MMIHEITEKVGQYKARKRVGRGRGSGVGKTSGRGHKGSKSRAGYSEKIGYEGGQMPYFRRIPKRGFSNAVFRTDYQLINVSEIEKSFESGATINAETLAHAGLIRDRSMPVKILGNGDLTKKVTITADKFSASAKQKIEASGGTVTQIVKKKWTRPKKARPAKPAT